MMQARLELHLGTAMDNVVQALFMRTKSLAEDRHNQEMQSMEALADTEEEAEEKRGSEVL